MQERHSKRSIIFAAIGVLVAVIAYLMIPGSEVASQWNPDGSIAGYDDKLITLFKYPLVSVIIAMLSRVLKLRNTHWMNQFSMTFSWGPLFLVFIQIWQICNMQFGFQEMLYFLIIPTLYFVYEYYYYIKKSDEGKNIEIPDMYKKKKKK